MSRLITVKQAKKYLRKNSVGAVYDLVARGVVPPGPLVRMGRTILFNEDLLVEWIERGGSAANNGETRNQESLAKVSA